MTYTRTATGISFKTRIDHVRIEALNTGYKIYADAEDREAVYSLTELSAADVAKALNMNIETTFLDFVEKAINAGQGDKLFSQIQNSGRSEFFWMNTEQIDRFLIGKEQVMTLEED
jgi:hypothetical protein